MIAPTTVDSRQNSRISIPTTGIRPRGDAIEHYNRALEIAPEHLSALNTLARVPATCPEASFRNGSRALELGLQADRLSGHENPAILDVLAVAYAEAGRFPEALKTARQALDLALRQNKTTLADAIRMRLQV